MSMQCAVGSVQTRRHATVRAIGLTGILVAVAARVAMSATAVPIHENERVVHLVQVRANRGRRRSVVGLEEAVCQSLDIAVGVPLQVGEEIRP